MFVQSPLDGWTGYFLGLFWPPIPPGGGECARDTRTERPAVEASACVSGCSRGGFLDAGLWH